MFGPPQTGGYDKVRVLELGPAAEAAPVKQKPDDGSWFLLFTLQGGQWDLAAMF